MYTVHAAIASKKCCHLHSSSCRRCRRIPLVLHSTVLRAIVLRLVLPDLLYPPALAVLGHIAVKVHDGLVEALERWAVRYGQACDACTLKLLL